MRNYGGSFWAMVAMICGFVTNIILDYAFVWAMGQGMRGAALAIIIGQEAIAIYACISYIICIVYLVLPPLFGGQIMIWWSAVFAKIITAGIGIFSSIENHTCQNIILLISS